MARKEAFRPKYEVSEIVLSVDDVAASGASSKIRGMIHSMSQKAFENKFARAVNDDYPDQRNTPVESTFADKDREIDERVAATSISIQASYVPLKKSTSNLKFVSKSSSSLNLELKNNSALLSGSTYSNYQAYTIQVRTFRFQLQTHTVLKPTKMQAGLFFFPHHLFRILSEPHPLRKQRRLHSI